MHSKKLAGLSVLACVLAACAVATQSELSNDPTLPAAADGGGAPFESVPSLGDAAAAEPDPCNDTSFSLPAPEDALLGSAFESLYRAYDLGPIPGVPQEVGQSLGGLTVRPEEPNVLYVIGESESINASLYRIEVKRDACKHIVAWVGTAEKLSNLPFADANILSTPYGWLYPTFPTATIGQLSPAGVLTESDLKVLGIRGPYTYNPADFGESPGGLAIVPSNLAGAGRISMTVYPTGDFYLLTIAATEGRVAVTSAEKRVQLQKGPGAFAYVPTGSPGFTAPSLVVTEWLSTPPSVAAYEVTEEGVPKPTTRRPFFIRFPRPWGAFFEPVTGDFLFATWRGPQGQVPDRVVQVRGFSVPPPPPAPK